ncbi:hypothetical protein JHK82_039559 [Glycine max]|uniref:Uncharacterized protein n=1 Tax=Glycine soja TaxID=3848 RepID=A0A0B2R3W2_GLYSO|nr:hypothetical protein JHK86_039746 [Glycine max]KAG4965347.1 hypothetical protein JHK85_040322 [Glycine max]KAG5110336.1 hypothetical protein JHK82_039559 [Glycine max]KAG5121621.1 hypothetical protein JHK84_039961 [Glycine max]KHN26904.1 hypothetical protein glysoja_039440 [Glycine soja]
MVKTRGLGHALGRVVGRGLGRGDGDDSDGAPQHRRPTASAHRRRVTVIVDDVVPAVPADSSAVPETEAVVARDEPMVDADAQDTGPDTDAQDIGTQDAADEPEGFLGGPKDPSVLTEYADHVAANVWSGQTDPPRDAYAMQPNHIPHEAALASTQADLDADEPRHAVEACHAITEALEQHLNAPGTSTHEEVIQKCLSIVRGVTEDRNVYVRSRRRCHTDQQ